MKVSEELGQIIVNPASFADPDLIDRTYAAIRQSTPLAQLSLPGFDPMWVVSRHADVQEVSRRNDDFHSGDRSSTIMPIEAEAAVRGIRGGRNNLVRSLVQMDAPDHKAHRLISQPAFMPQNVAKLTEQVRQIARKYVDRMLSFDGEIDFANEVAFPFPLEVVMTVLGVPVEDHQKMLTWTQWLFDSADPDLRRPGAVPQTMGEAITELNEVWGHFEDYYTAFAADRRANPRADLGSVLCAAQVDGRPMGHHELISYFVIASTAGHDTTSATTATSMWQLAQNPAILDSLKGHPLNIAGFVEESIRWATPVKHFIRSATKDTMLGDTAIQSGDLLLLAYPSANRDETVFENPFTFDPTRSPNRHVGFGYGGHVCLGQHLARAEMRIFWEELLPHLSKVEMATPAQFVASNFVSGPKTVPIRFTKA